MNIPATTQLNTDDIHQKARKTDAAAQQKLQYDLSIATPAMKQYFTLKHAYPDCLLFYRMGDFYELFFDDAVQAAKILGIALTKRGKHGGNDVAMCGVPVHSHENYLEKLIASGAKIAICEQLETPEEARKKRGHKAIVERDVVRVITPGTITEEGLLDSGKANYLAAAAVIKQHASLGWIDLSTGEFFLQPSEPSKIQDIILRLSPSEILLPDNSDLCRNMMDSNITITPQAANFFDSRKGERLLKTQYNIAAIESLGAFTASDMAVCAALLEYVNLTQKGNMPHLARPRIIGEQQHMAIDAATRNSLEINKTIAGEYKGSLMHAINHTVTAAGARMLANRLHAPLTDIKIINKRLDKVEYFVQQHNLRQEIRDILRNCPDMERAISRLYLNRGSARDMLAIANALEIALMIREAMATQTTGHPQIITSYLELNTHDTIRQELKKAIKQDPPLFIRDGGFIADGYHTALDEFRNLKRKSKQHIAALQASYQKLTGISSLKIKFNNILGYFVEITPNHESKITNEFIHRQTMKNALRYSSKELAELEHKLRDADDKATKLELELFANLLEMVKLHADSLQETARKIAELDISTSLAELAVTYNYCRPIVDNSAIFKLRQARHPVVEQSLCREGASFVANDCILIDSKDKDNENIKSYLQGSNDNTQLTRSLSVTQNIGSNLWLITGPNMAGKSTFLRQNALIAIMAQIGSFVPAETAHIGVIDKLFSRVGAADDIAKGRSTFMVEMVETASILNQATAKSLVILDEIGRGTATFDGLSIAWAVIEYLHNHNRCRTLFATHYHELTQLESELPNMSCHHIKVKEWKGEIIFLHNVTAGAADRSYGVHVAKLAGLPTEVIERANYILHMLEQDNRANKLQQSDTELPLLAYCNEPSHKTSQMTQADTVDSINKLLADCDPDMLTPRDALDLVYKLKQLL